MFRANTENKEEDDKERRVEERRTNKVNLGQLAACIGVQRKK
jgi:hypothetical protein|tara:strand:+ start:450 stop:575 length:126 start_codon:yes stop_codon:yes gene_type:complete